jgi:hypothetical protein
MIVPDLRSVADVTLTPEELSDDAPTSNRPDIVAPVPLFFIGGLGRSGSTLLDRVIGQIPGCWSTGEMVQIWQAFTNDVRCGCGRLPRDCPYWTSVIDRAFGGWETLDVRSMWQLQRAVDRNRFVVWLLFPRLTRRFKPRFERDVAAYLDVLARLYRAMYEVSGARLLVDSGKHSSYAFLLRRLALARVVDLHVVHLVRDPRGVAFSWAKVVNKSDFADAGQMDRYPPGQMAVRWVSYNLLFELLARTFRRTRRLRYEDFVSAPETVTASLLEMAGMPSDAAATVFAAPAQVELTHTDHTVAGNPMRFRTGRLDIRQDEAWRREMPAVQRRIVSVLTAPMRYAYGYRGHSG